MNGPAASAPSGNQLMGHGLKVWLQFVAKSWAAMAALVTPMPPPLLIVGSGLLCVHLAWYMLSCLSVFSDLNQAPFSTSVEHHSNVGYEFLGRQGSGQYSLPVCRLHQWWEWVASSFDTSCLTQLCYTALCMEMIINNICFLYQTLILWRLSPTTCIIIGTCAYSNYLCVLAKTLWL